MNIEQLHTELQFRFSRSSGSGGQHVNKVSSQVEALLDVDASLALTDKEKEKLHKRLEGRINQEGILSIRASDTRSQHRNRELAVRRLDELIQEALRPRAKRKKVKPLQANKKKRLKAKKIRSEKKAMRGKVQLPQN